jgi:2-methylcitrate dehydratase PrpD
VAFTSLDLAQFIAEATPGPGARATAWTAILDTLAVMLAGSVEEAAVTIGTTFEPVLARAGFPSFDPAVRLRGEDAALLYGTAAHALDYDDVSMLAICHPSAPVLAALLAAEDWANVSGAQLAEAHAIGTEVMVRMGQAIGFAHYELGFHATATMGVFGATAAVARLRGLNAAQTANALAVAASLASGISFNFGSMMKPVHVGIAAANGLRAAAWSSSGVEASRGDLFGPRGVFGALSGGRQVNWPEDVALGQPFAIEAPGFELKRYPCCYMLHRVISLGRHVSDAGLKLSAIASLRVEMPRGGTRPLIHPFPASGKQAMFSGPYTLLAAIADGDISFASFEDQALARPEIRSRLADVKIEEVAGPALTPEQIGAAPVRLGLGLNDGSTLRFECLASPGSPADPLVPGEQEAKWIDCLRRANPALLPGAAAELRARAVEGLGVGALPSWLVDLWRAAGWGTTMRAASA